MTETRAGRVVVALAWLAATAWQLDAAVPSGWGPGRARAEPRRTPPPDLPDRFQVERVLHAVSTGLEGVTDGGRVAAVDCSEYPCLMFGEGFGTRAEADALRASDALREYAGDTTAVFGWSETDGEGGPTEKFAVAIIPGAGASDGTLDGLGSRLQAARATARAAATHMQR
jgi:hypothetical protein